MLKVREVMTTKVYSLTREMGIEAAMKEFDRRGISGAPVVDGDGILCGHLSRTTVFRYLSKSGRPLAEPKVSEVMEEVAYEVVPEDSVRDLLSIMLPSRIHRMVVTDDQGRPAGIITTMDLMGYLFDLLAAEGS